jgi:hypothetical protein
MVRKEDALNMAVGGGSAWWREIIKIQEGVGVEGGSWFEASLTRRLGNGLNTYFWSDCWAGVVTQKERFRRLYDLSNHDGG